MNIMSWDVYIQDFPPTAKTLAEIPDDFELRPIGMRSDITAMIRDVIPSVNFTNLSWGTFENNDFSIEFQMGDEENCTSVFLLVRGGGNPVPLIAALLDRLQLRGVDLHTGEFFDVESARDSFGTWQSYRDKILAAKDGKRE